jgi:8-oxo-dGTP pyrophosphatase MutT (NUDIX family)
MTAYGLHVNGFVRQPASRESSDPASSGPASGNPRSRDLELWIARRSSDRSVAPGKRDNLIAGGQPVGLSLAQNLIKEAYEEAAIGPELASQAVPVGAITYMFETPPGLKVDCLFIYDLELPADFAPRNTDGEVESFERLPWTRVAEIVRDTDQFKFNCNLVIIDFLIRHGLLRPDHPEYLPLAAGLRRWWG